MNSVTRFLFTSFRRAEDSPTFLDFLAKVSHPDVGERFAKYGRTAAHSEPQVIQTISPIEMVDQIDEQTVPRSFEIEGSPTSPFPRIVEPSDLLEFSKSARRRKQESARRPNSCKLCCLAEGCPQEENAQNKEKYNPDRQMTKSKLDRKKRFLPGGWHAFRIACATNEKSF
jgi:hypothetical protein